MKRKLENPKVIFYKNVERVAEILRLELDFIAHDETNYEAIAKAILDEFNISYGKKTKVELFQNNLQAVIENGKIIVKTK